MASPLLADLLAGKTIASAEGGFVIAEWQDAGGHADRRPIAPLHLHHHDDEAWYVLEGVLEVQLGERVWEAHAGAAVLAPRGTPHTYWNAGPGRLRYLLVMTSRIYQLIQAIHATAERNPKTMQALFREYDSELLR